MSKSSRIIFAAFITAICWLLYTFSTDVFMYSDNVGVALVINGYYGSPLCQYQHPLFCVIVNLLSKVFPTVDIYTFIVHTFIAGELFILVYIMSKNITSRKLIQWKMTDYVVLLMSVLVVFFLSSGLNLWRANYTIQASSFLFTGLVVLDQGVRQGKYNRYNSLIASLYITVGYMLRKEAGWLFIPFVLLYSIYFVVTHHSEKAAFRQIAHSFLPVCICVALLFASQIILDNVEPYAEAKRYNEARTTLVDFPVKNWNEFDTLDSINREDYSAAVNWLFADTEVMNTEYLERMAAAGSRKKYPFTIDGFYSAMNDIWQIIGKTDVFMSVMAFIAVLLALWNIINEPSWWGKGTAFSAIAGAFFIMLYFTFRGRAPLRVWQPVLFATLFVEITLMINAFHTARSAHRIAVMFILFITLYFSAGQVFAHIGFHTPQNAFTGRVNADDSAYEQTINDDDLYIWPNWHATIPTVLGWHAGKLPTLRVLEHNIPLGDWTYGQPYYNDFLERIGHKNPIRDLVEKDNVYIMSNSQYIVDFLRKHYGEDVVLVEAGEVNGMTAYAVER